jgi:hypothetical protein
MIKTQENNQVIMIPVHSTKPDALYTINNLIENVFLTKRICHKSNIQTRPKINMSKQKCSRQKIKQYLSTNRVTLCNIIRHPVAYSSTKNET